MIRRAETADAKDLTAIAFQSKAHWNYPAEYFELWRNELTITADYIAQNRVFVWEQNGRVEGFYSIVELGEDLEVSGVVLESGLWLDHMFILPECIGKKIGTRLFQHFRSICRNLRAEQVGILADPNARGFYEKMGCLYQREYPSSIPGRTTPLYFLPLKEV